MRLQGLERYSVRLTDCQGAVTAEDTAQDTVEDTEAAVVGLAWAVAARSLLCVGAEVVARAITFLFEVLLVVEAALSNTALTEPALAWVAEAAVASAEATVGAAVGAATEAALATLLWVSTLR